MNLICRLAFWVAMLFQVVVLYAPGSAVPTTPSIAGNDTLIHVCLFALPALLWTLYSAKRWPLLLLALHAPISELIQGWFIQGRSAELSDCIADLFGVAVGAAVGSFIRFSRAARDDQK